jgi:hypothetical protein
MLPLRAVPLSIFGFIALADFVAAAVFALLAAFAVFAALAVFFVFAVLVKHNLTLLNALELGVYAGLPIRRES